jgi:hypothetical protein
MLGSDNPGERENARRMLDEELTRHKKTWNDLPELLATGTTQHDDHAYEEPLGNTRTGRPAPLDLIRHILQRHLHLKEHQFVALTLWIAHTFVYFRFAITPRLALVSPVRGCGKTTVLNLVKALGFKTRKTDNTTAAVLFRLIDRNHPTMLLDEVDNQDLATNSTLRAVITSGHHYEGMTSRYLDGQVVEFSTFAPLALAAIGRLPFPILHRSIVLHMERIPAAAGLLRFDPKTNEAQKQDCNTVYREMINWTRQCQLNLDPLIPEGLRNRPADNWRPLLSIADAGSPAWGDAARVAAVALSKGQDEDLAVLLLSDIRDIFDRRPTTDRFPSAVLVAELNELSDARWNEWRGPRDDQATRRLSQSELARVLSPFGIKPNSIWPLRRGTKTKSSKGYYRKQFEAAWASYCDGTAAQPSNVRYLRGA